MEENKKEHTIEERMKLSLLYDFYGALLKENQQRMFEASVLEDYNLSEIAEDEGITRQGVHDAIKRASKQLYSYEEKLGLVEKFQRQKELVTRLHKQLIDMNISQADSRWKDILSELEEIIEN